MTDTATSSQAACCGAAPRLIFACSGAADVGKLSDLAARELTAAGAGKMFCLAGIGGRVSGIMATTEAAQAILAIDGCPLDCAKKTLENTAADAAASSGGEYQRRQQRGGSREEQSYANPGRSGWRQGLLFARQHALPDLPDD